MYNGYRNVRVFSEMNRNADKVNIYIDITGKRYEVMLTRKSTLPYLLLHDGIAIENLVRWDRKSQIRKVPMHLIRSGRMECFVKRLLQAVNCAMYDYGLIDEEV